MGQDNTYVLCAVRVETDSTLRVCDSKQRWFRVRTMAPRTNKRGAAAADAPALPLHVKHRRQLNLLYIIPTLTNKISSAHQVKSRRSHAILFAVFLDSKKHTLSASNLNARLGIVLVAPGILALFELVSSTHKHVVRIGVWAKLDRVRRPSGVEGGHSRAKQGEARQRPIEPHTHQRAVQPSSTHPSTMADFIQALDPAKLVLVETVSADSQCSRVA